MSCNHSHTGLAHKLCKALTLSEWGLEHRSGGLAAAVLAWFDSSVDLHGMALPVDPDEVDGESHPDHVDRPRAREQQGMSARQFLGSEQSAEPGPEGAGHVDHFTGSERHVRQAT